MKNSPTAPVRGEKKQRIVSSAHLVSPKSPELSEIEFGMIIATHAFNRWMIRCMNAAGAKDMTPVDVLVMHHINHRSSAKRLADICFVLNIEDTHVVSYSVKKLIGMNLVTGTKRGKEVFLNPSFLAMSRIGTPEQIVDAFVKVHAGHYPKHRITDIQTLKAANARCFAEMAAAAANVVRHCSEGDIAEIIGSYSVTTAGRLLFKPGSLPVEDVIQLARHLIGEGGTTAQAERDLMVWTYKMIGLVVLHWSLLLTVAVGCFIVRVMKGPAYVADAYEMEELDPDPSPLPLPLSGR
mgnify:CR=1 FL=1